LPDGESFCLSGPTGSSGRTPVGQALLREETKRNSELENSDHDPREQANALPHVSSFRSWTTSINVTAREDGKRAEPGQSPHVHRSETDRPSGTVEEGGSDDPVR